MARLASHRRNKVGALLSKAKLFRANRVQREPTFPSKQRLHSTSALDNDESCFQTQLEGGRSGVRTMKGQKFETSSYNTGTLWENWVQSAISFLFTHIIGGGWTSYSVRVVHRRRLSMIRPVYKRSRQARSLTGKNYPYSFRHTLFLVMAAWHLFVCFYYSSFEPCVMLHLLFIWTSFPVACEVFHEWDFGVHRFLFVVLQHSFTPKPPLWFDGSALSSI